MQFGYFLGNLSGNDCEANSIAAVLNSENFGEGGSRCQWNPSRCGYKIITLFAWSIVPVQCLSEYFSAPIRR